MKKKLLTITVIALTVLSISAQSLKYKSLRNEIINYGYTISLERYADLRQGNIAFDWKTFYAGYEYVIFACSDDDDVIDMDVALFDGYGNLYQEDGKNEYFAYLKLTPYLTQDMKIVVKNDISNTPYYASRCRFIVAYK